MNSVGQTTQPTYAFWSLGLSKSNNQGFRYFIIDLIWLIWFVQQWFLFMICLNFVIALISQSYDSVMTKYEEILYKQRTYLNRECRLVLKSLKIKDRMDRWYPLKPQFLFLFHLFFYLTLLHLGNNEQALKINELI